MDKKKKTAKPAKKATPKKAPAKKAPAKKAEPKKTVTKKPVVKKTSAKKAPAKKTPAKKPAHEEVSYRTYHLVKREDGKWEVKFAKGQKAIKLFDTQAEALEYSKKMAKNQDGSVLIHASKGKNKGRIQKKR